MNAFIGNRFIIDQCLRRSVLTEVGLLRKAFQMLRHVFGTRTTGPAADKVIH